MSGGNLVVHRRTPNQRRAEWCATDALQRSVVMVGRRRLPGAVAFHSVGIRGIDAHIDAAFPLSFQRVRNAQCHLANVLYFDVDSFTILKSAQSLVVGTAG